MLEKIHIYITLIVVSIVGILSLFSNISISRILIKLIVVMIISITSSLIFKFYITNFIFKKGTIEDENNTKIDENKKDKSKENKNTYVHEEKEDFSK